jgi:RNA polymerase sigma-70 factor (ECF subfamily)
MQQQEYWSKVYGVSRQEDIVATLYQIHAPPLFAYLRLHTSSREDAEDLLVDVFLAVLENKYFFLLAEPAQRAWLWRVTRNKVVDVFRKQHIQRGLLPLDTLAEALQLDERHTPEQAMLRAEEFATLREAIQRLPEVQQQVLWLRFVSGLRCVEIAKVLGRRAGTVRSLLSRALNLLRHDL